MALLGYVTLLSNTCQGFVPEVLTEIIGACVQEDRLWIADPKAFNHILQKSGYLYAKPCNILERSALLGDRGIIAVEGDLPITINPSSSPNNPAGDVHKRHRRAMAPAFGLVEAKGLLPYFVDCATKARELRLCPILKSDSGPCPRWRTSGAASLRTTGPDLQPLSMQTCGWGRPPLMRAS